MKPIGFASVNFNALYDDLSELACKELEDKPLWKSIYKRWGNNQKTDIFKLARSSYENLFPQFPSYVIQNYDKNKEASEMVEKGTEYLRRVQQLVELGTSKLRCLYEDDGKSYEDEGLALLYLGGYASALVLPSRYVTVQKYQNYDELSAKERHAMLSGGQISQDSGKDVASIDTRTALQAKSELSTLTSTLKSLDEQMKQVESADIPELSSLKAKIQKLEAELQQKINVLLTELNRKKEELAQKKKELEFEIYRLSSEIYSIRCYTGECVTFALIRDGVAAEKTTPLVINQKMRYMDEELGRLASIYNVDFDDVELLEKLLKFNAAAFEVFCPTRRCVTLVRVSRDNKKFTCHETYANMLDMTEKYRGRAIGILIRDGEKLFMGWTDEEHINFPDELFFHPGVSEENAIEKSRYESDEDFEKRMERLRLKQLDQAIGRSFIFSVLQGVVDRKMIAFPDGVTVRVNRPSDFVVRNYADAWITDERYGTFDSMIARCNETVMQGDSILMMQSLCAERRDRSYGWRDDRWNNDRGIGDKNRTHDVFACDGTIYKINKVVVISDYTIQYEDDDGTLQTSNYNERTEDEIKNILCRVRNWKNPKVISITNSTEHLYISLKKQYSMSGTARANFEIFTNEFVNLTYMNSTWLEYVIQTQKTGVIVVGGVSVNFAHLIPYMKKALDFVRKREAEELAILLPFVPEIQKDPEWPAKLSEWKLENGVRVITEYQAKRFAKTWDSKINKE